jgi:hypothetical protein
MNSTLRNIRPLLAVAAAAIACVQSVNADDNRAPDVAAALEAPGGTNKVHYHVDAIGVQIYRATPSTTTPGAFVWTFVAPEAILYDADGNEVGIHYAGPTWESNSGSLVRAARVSGVTVDPNNIPWLLLQAVSTSGPGIFERTTYIQRVNTLGGNAPSTPPTQAGEEARVPYTTEYYFYREK